MSPPRQTPQGQQKRLHHAKIIADGRRTVNVGRKNADKTVELEIAHGIITIIAPVTGKILAEQTLDTTRDYQYRKPMPGVNHAPSRIAFPHLAGWSQRAVQPGTCNGCIATVAATGI
ncbi:hypothetical protein [Bifidobacterium felsineum]|uniref:hypothetical protein n=1 Tax=Bifidobacterium felsineum TaxID=2045440 RepID=UPI001054930A|nr:hypothetical protein [Bifidobacterium felsineum]